MCFDDFDWEDMMSMAGALAEEIALEQKRSVQDEEVFNLDKENEEYESGKNL